MTEPGIGSLEELLFFYVYLGFIVTMLWGAISADVLTTTASTDADRRQAMRRRAGRAIAPLGLLHIGFALVAYDLARFPPDDAPAVDQAGRRRAMTEAKLCFAAGLASLALLARTMTG